MSQKRFWCVRHRAIGARPVDSSPPARQFPPDLDHAWKTLSLVNEWIRHSDAKAGVTLAFTGVLATMTFNLAKDFQYRDTAFDVLVVVACSLLILTAVLCGWTLVPRTKGGTPKEVNHLYFASISANFRGKREDYREALRTLTEDPDELTKELADQILANATVAMVKTSSARWAIRSALFAGAAVAALAIFIGIANS